MTNLPVITRKMFVSTGQMQDDGSTQKILQHNINKAVKINQVTVNLSRNDLTRELESLHYRS